MGTIFADHISIVGLIAAFLIPVPLVHLWLHALIPFWRKHPFLFYIWSSILFLFPFTVVPPVVPLTPVVFRTNLLSQSIGILFFTLGMMLVFSSLFTLGIKRFVMWPVLHPEQAAPRVHHGPFQFLPHPAYVGYLFTALANWFIDGHALHLGILLYILVTIPLVIKFEEQELANRQS